MNTQLFKAVQDGDLEFLTDYCKNGEEREKFFEIMTFGLVDTEREGKFGILVSAENNKPDILDFLVQHAIKDEPGKIMLAHHLLQKNYEGKNALHEAASIPNNNRCISILCNIAAELANADKHNQALANYVNTPDSKLGGTPLHFSVRRCCYCNYIALINANADKSLRANNGMKPIQFIQFADFHEAKVFMAQYLATSDGINYFKKRHGHDLQTIPVSAKFLNKLIEIDLHMDQKQNAASQLQAFKDTLRAIASHSSSIERDILIATLGSINYLVFNEDKLKNDDSAEASLLIKLLSKAEIIKEPSIKSEYITAEILLHTKKFAKTSMEAMNYYAVGALLANYPQLVLEGLQNIEARYLLSNEKTLLAKRIILARSYIVLNELKEMRTLAGISKILYTDNVTPAKQALEKFTAGIKLATSICDILMLIESLPKLNYIADLKNDLFSEIGDSKYSHTQEV